MARISKNKLTGIRHYFSLDGNELRHHHWICVWNIGTIYEPEYIFKGFSLKKQMPAYARDFLLTHSKPCHYGYFISGVVQSMVAYYYGSTADTKLVSGDNNIYAAEPIDTEYILLYDASQKSITEYNLCVMSGKTPDEELHTKAKDGIKFINRFRLKYGLGKSGLKLRRKVNHF